MKYLIFDSGPLINFSMNGSLNIIKKLKKEFSGKFIITKEVKRETMDYPETVKRFELEALQLEALFQEKIIELPILNKDLEKQLEEKTFEILNVANNTFYSKNKSIHLIDKGEAACLALALLLKDPCTLVIDERTTRMMCENPENLRKLLQKKLHTNITANKNNYSLFSQFKIIRSTELAYIANKKKLFDLKDPRALDAMLYGLKFKGCSISDEEIEQIKKL